MAYSNWGAFVYRSGERRRDKEDVPAFGDATAEAAVPSGARIWVNLRKRREKGGAAKLWEHAHHAVLGDGPVRLCGYKAYPVLWIARGEAIEEVKLTYRDDRGDRQSISGELDGHHWIATPFEDPDGVELWLREPDGTEWTGRSGYCMGAGHQDDGE